MAEDQLQGLHFPAIANAGGGEGVPKTMQGRVGKRQTARKGPMSRVEA